MGGESNLMNSISNDVLVAANVIMPSATVALVCITWRYLKATKALVEESKRMRETQRELQERQLKQDLFSKRLKVFDSLTGFLGNFPKGVESGQRARFLQDTHEAEFLFPDDAVDVINQVWEKASDHEALNTVFDHVSAELASSDEFRAAERDLEGKKNRLSLQLTVLDKWFLTDARKLVKEKFKPHLTLRDG